MFKKEFLAGLRASLPVFIGYFSVSFGFGTLAATQGLPFWQATLISLTNVTSAGQFAGLTVIAEGGSLITMMLSQLVINSRYALMSLALGQKMGKRFGVLERLITAFYNTDEIFALAMAKDALTVPYMLGLGVLPIVGWTGGTLLGALVGAVLPPVVETALGVALYGMFVAIVVPQIKTSRPHLTVTLLAIGLACLFRFTPYLRTMSSGLAIVIVTVVAAAVTALLFPVSESQEETA
ncbi:MAG: AzlC family ABC transporter permease [Ruminococcaceae bacterium]|nr:AzlC family ABC transporter permease [Oscillospiraceae bacterium]